MTEEQMQEQEDLLNIDCFYMGRNGKWQYRVRYWVGTGWQVVWRECEAA